MPGTVRERTEQISRTIFSAPFPLFLDTKPYGMITPLLAYYTPDVCFRHRERRQSFKEDRKERKIKKKQQQKISRFPKKPEWMVRESSLQRRRVRSREAVNSTVLY